MPRRLTKILITGLVGAALLTGIIVYTISTPKHDVASGVAHDDRFPPGATDINYNIMRGVLGGWKNADFLITEADFVSYCSKANWKLNPITKPREFRTNLDPQGDLNTRVIDDGLIYESPIAENGGFTLAVYDRTSRRAMIRSSSN